MELTEAQTAALWAHVDRRANHQCWLWRGAPCSHRYPRVWIGTYRGAPAARVLYAMLCGPVARGQFVRAKCRNRACVNPYHHEVVRNPTRARRVCQRGHVDQWVTYGTGIRRCHPCKKAAWQRYAKKRLAKRVTALEATEDIAC